MRFEGVGFCLSTYGQDDDPSLATIRQEIADNDFTRFAARFVNGLIHQTSIQTGSLRPVGETTVNRIVNDLGLLWTQLSGTPPDIDWAKFHAEVRLDVKR